MCVAFLVNVVVLLLRCSGDVETNPGPPCKISIMLFIILLTMQNSTYTVELIPANIQKLRNLINAAKSRWFDLGLELGIKHVDLEVIKQEHHKVVSRFREMLLMWLKMINPHPSWKDLLLALQQPSVGCSHLVQEMKQDLGIPEEEFPLLSG